MSKFYTLRGHSCRLSSIISVSETREEDFSTDQSQKHGFDIHFAGWETSWWIGYDSQEMATAQRAKLMEALEEGET